MFNVDDVCLLITIDSIEEDSWISIFLDVILILIYIKLECRFVAPTMAILKQF